MSKQSMPLLMACVSIQQKPSSPFLWADVPAPKWRDTEGSRRVAGEATEFGICSGFAVPMLSVHHWQSVLSFASSAKCCSLTPREQVQLVTMAVYAGMSIQALTNADGDEDLLTEREKEVLLWAAAGKTSSETSQILGLTERTVKWHSTRAREAFGVATTTQAVVEAVRRRLDPRPVAHANCSIGQVAQIKQPLVVRPRSMGG